MHRQPLLHLLRRHSPSDAHEAAMTAATLAFVAENPDCFRRSLLPGHVTGSAWIVSPDRRQVVLIHHRKLDRWLQPGGHADGDSDVAAVARREAREETGLTSLRFVLPAGAKPSNGIPAIFDVDVHGIPARGEVPAHKHYDIRFLLEADPAEPFGQSDEVNNSRWIYRSEVRDYTREASIGRMLEKMEREPNLNRF